MHSPGSVGEPVAGRPRRAGRLLRRVGLRLGGSRCLRNQDAQTLAVLGDAPLGGLAEVVPEAPPVRDLHGLRGADGGALGEERRTVTAHHLDSWPLGQPSGQARGLPVGQQVDGPAGFDVHEDSSVVAALAGGVLVDAEHARSGHFRFGKCVDQPQDRAAADRRTEYVGQAGAGPTREGETDRGQGRAEPLGPLAVPSGQAGYLLDERATSTLGVPAGEPADPQPEYDASSPARNISGKPNVGAVNPGGPRSTTRTRGARGGAPRRPRRCTAHQHALSRYSRLPTTPRRPRSTGTTTRPAGARSYSQFRTVGPVTSATARFEATFRDPTESSAATRSA